MKHLWIVLIAGLISAEEVPTVRPGSPDVDASILVPFQAEYEQLGTTFRLHVLRSTGDAPVIAALMTMEAPDGFGVDHVAHRAKDLSFAYRLFSFRRWGREYVEARFDGEDLRIARMPMEGDGTRREIVETAEGPFFDGTFGHWLLGTLPLGEGYSARLASWQLTEDGAELYDSPPARVLRRETVAARDGTAYECWVVEIRASAGTFRNYLVKRPPFLVKQVMMPKEGEPVTTLLLTRPPRLD